MSTLPLDHALGLARQGVGVLPCRNIPNELERHKAPLTAHGFWDAATDEAVVRAWWERWPNALVGAVAERFCVVDVDLHHAEARAWLERHRDKIPITRTHRTQRGGLHIVFHAHPKVGCSVGILAPHVDTRGQGKGYVIWWPAHGLAVAHREVIAAVPEWIVIALRPATSKPAITVTTIKRLSDIFVTAKLAGIINRAASAQEGERNAVTFWCGCRLAEMVRDQMIGREEAIALLIEASSRTGLRQREILRTARSISERIAMTDMDDAPSTAETVDNLINMAERRKKLREAIQREDFVAYLPSHNYIYMPTREPWPGSSVNAILPPVQISKDKSIAASTWIDRHQAVEQMTWAPGEGELIHDRLISGGGWIERTGATCLNLYRPPTLMPGNSAEAKPWLDHVYKVFGEDDGLHIVTWLAQRVQRPQVKVNHALVLGGSQGIGKDTLLEPVKRAIGPWNFSEVSPQHVLGRFNGFVKSVVLRVSEARDLGELNRYQFYDHLKTYTAAPPDVLRVDEKYLREHNVLNCCGVVITTNYKSDGIYLPPDDRRHYVAWSNLTRNDFTDDYWNTLWDFYECGGDRHVATYLTELNISKFDPKSPPPKTAAFWDIVYANRAPEDAELADVLDRMGNPNATTLLRIADAAAGEVQLWINDRKNRRAIPHRLERCGYVPVRNTDASDGLWKIHGKRQVIYAKAELSPRDQYAAASTLVAGK